MPPCGGEAEGVAVGVGMVLGGLAADDIGVDLFQVLGDEGVECSGVIAVGEVVSFEGAGDVGLVDLVLVSGGVLIGAGEVGGGD